MSSTAPGESDSADLSVELSGIAQLLESDPVLAEKRASQFLETRPDHPGALLLQGIARRRAGNAAEAAEVLTRLCRIQPGDAHGHMHLGLALWEAGQRKEAAESLRRAANLAPDLNDAWRGLAELLFDMGDRAGADAAFAGYVRNSGKDPRLLAPQAALRENRSIEAESLLRQHLDRHPMDIIALGMLADVAGRHGRPDTAETLLKRCLELAPSYHPARYRYANLLMRVSRPDEALSQCERIMEAEPGAAEPRNLKAAILVSMNRYEEAIGIYEELLREYPAQAVAWMSLGHALRTVGRREESIAAYRRTIELMPGYGEAYWNLANFKTVPFSDSELEVMRARLADPAAAPDDRAHLHFAMGKALEDRNDYAEAFQNYLEGNRIRRESVRYDADQASAYMRRCKALFTKTFFAEREGCGAENQDPIFIIGLPRSGSTLVEQILASHPAVEGTMELSNLLNIAASLSDPSAENTLYPQVLGETAPDALRRLGQTYLEQTRMFRRRGTPFFIDKMPNNFLHVGLIHLILPRARIVDVRRHPLACTVSIFRHLFAEGQPFSYSLEEIGRYYRDYVELMLHFDAVLPGRIHRVFYERLVNDTETEVRRLLDYCGLPFDPDCLEFHRNQRAVTTPSSEQVRSPIFSDAVDHWRHYEPWLGTLQAVLGSLVDAYPGMVDSKPTSR